MSQQKSITHLAENVDDVFLDPPPGLKVFSKALEIPLVGDAVDQTLSLHNSFMERGGIIGKAYSMWFSTACKSLNIAASALNATRTTQGAQKMVWAKWITIDKVLAAKLGIDLGPKKIPMDFLVHVGPGTDDHIEGETRTGEKITFSDENLEYLYEEMKAYNMPDVCTPAVAKNTNSTDSVDDVRINYQPDDNPFCVLKSAKLKSQESSNSRTKGFSVQTENSDFTHDSSLDSEFGSDQSETLLEQHGETVTKEELSNPEENKIVLETYLALNQINLTEEDPLEKQFGLLDDILGLYSHIGNQV